MPNQKERTIYNLQTSIEAIDHKLLQITKERQKLIKYRKELLERQKALLGDNRI